MNYVVFTGIKNYKSFLYYWMKENIIFEIIAFGAFGRAYTNEYTYLYVSGSFILCDVDV